MKYFYTIAMFVNTMQVIAQDTIKVMQYNLLYYGQTSSYCTTSNNNETAKDGYLKTIIKYVKPDIFTVNELAPISSQQLLLMNNCLNVDGVNYYNKCNLSNASGSDLSNQLFYNSEKLGFVSQVNISTSVRDIDIYKLYYKSWNLSSTHDTAYVTCIVVDLKAGSASSDASERATETNTLMNYLNLHGINNYMVMGDFNVYTSTETCYQNLINYSNANIRFYDPVNMPGDWHSNSLFSHYHSQSTHNTSTSDCFVTGGMDDRFDFILISNNINNGLDHFQYLSGSYITVGEDGNHFNKDINYGTNNSAPDSVIQALYGMSDHLPVTLKLRVNQTVGVNTYEETASLKVFFNNPVDKDMPISITSSTKEKLKIEIINILGKTICFQTTSNEGCYTNITLPTKALNSGIYFLKITDSRNNAIIRKFIKG